MSGRVYLNGKYLPREEARVSVDDRGFNFGDGVYEVIRAFDGRVFQAEAHNRRLERSLAGLEITGAPPAADLQAVGERLLEENDFLDGHATIYMQITRGTAPRKHQFPAAGTLPNVFVSCARFTPSAEQHEKGMAAITLPDIRWARCDLKTISLLPNAIAKQRAVEAGAFEAVLIRDGAVTEGAHSNLFAVVDGELRTFPRCNYILPGITRDVLIEIAGEMGIPVDETPVLAGELFQVEELFACGTTTDVTPLVRVDGKPIADGAPGPISRRLYAALLERITAEAAVPA